MSKKYFVPASSKPDAFSDVVSINDVETYSIDLTAWEEDNNTITTATWTNENGNVGISGVATANGVTQADLTFNEKGRALISILVETSTQKKKVWLSIRIKDLETCSDDYGING